MAINNFNNFKNISTGNSNVNQKNISKIKNELSEKEKFVKQLETSYSSKTKKELQKEILDLSEIDNSVEDYNKVKQNKDKYLKLSKIYGIHTSGRDHTFYNEITNDVKTFFNMGGITLNENGKMLIYDDVKSEDNTITYYKNGNKIKTINKDSVTFFNGDNYTTYNSDGTFEKATADDNNIISSYYSADGTLLKKTKYNTPYDNKESVLSLEKTYYNSDGSVKRIEKRGSDNKFSEAKVFFSDGSYIEYDGNGITKVTNKNGSSVEFKENMKSQTDVDANGNVIRETTKFENRETVIENDVKTVKTYGDDGKLTYMTIDNGNEQRNIQYDDQEKVVFEYTKDRIKKVQTEKSYDKDGNLYCMKIINANDGTNVQNWYDKSGNISSTTTTQIDKSKYQNYFNN